MIAAIDSHNRGSSHMAQSGRFIVKNSRLQVMCSMLLMPQRANICTRCAGCSARRQASTAATMISTNIDDQITPNAQSGGFHAGCFRA